MALTAEIQPRFNEWNPAHYRLFGIRTVVAPAGIKTPIPPFWSREATIGRFDVFRVPDTGYFDVVDAPAAVHTTKHNFYDVNEKWLESGWADKRLHLLLDLGGPVPDRLRLPPEDPLPALPSFPAAGSIRAEQGRDNAFQADCEIARASYVLFKMTWHPNWHATVDGRPASTAMLSPGFIGVPVSPGRHRVELRYDGSAWKLWLALAGVIAVFAQKFLPGALPRPAFPERIRRKAPQLGTAAGVLLLALPVAIPLLTSRLPVGDDALGYLPRQIEFHRNLEHGILLPRWAPDLDRGAGQPTLLFVPPLLHYLAEACGMAGLDRQASINIASAALVMLFGAGMFLLGRLYFGVWGGFLAAAAALYAPYVSLDLYVRAALSEFSAFPFCAFTLYGFGALARTGRRRYLVLGAAAYAGVVCSHFLVALYFTPLLAAFLLVTASQSKQPAIRLWQAAGVVLGIGLAACVWVPILCERRYVQLERATQGNFHYSNHLLSAQQLFAGAWGYGYSVPGSGDTISFALGWGVLALVALAWIVIRRRAWLIFYSAAAAVFCLLTLEQSAPVWEWLPLLGSIQFPWRLLGPASMCLALAVAALGPVLSAAGRWRKLVFAGALAVLILPNLSHLAPRAYRDLDLHLWTPDYLADSGFETTSSGEFMPRWMHTAPARSLRNAWLLSGEGSIREQSRTPFSWSGTAQIRTPATLQLAIAYFPGWQVRVDGHAVTPWPTEPTGLIALTLPAGQHTIDAEWKHTAPRSTGESITLASLLVCGFLLLRDRRSSL